MKLLWFQANYFSKLSLNYYICHNLFLIHAGFSNPNYTNTAPHLWWLVKRTYSTCVYDHLLLKNLSNNIMMARTKCGCVNVHQNHHGTTVWKGRRWQIENGRNSLNMKCRCLKNGWWPRSWWRKRNTGDDEIERSNWRINSSSKLQSWSKSCCLCKGACFVNELFDILYYCNIHCLLSVILFYIVGLQLFRTRSDRCDELKRLELAYMALRDQLEYVELKNEQLEHRKIQSLSRYDGRKRNVSLKKCHNRHLTFILHYCFLLILIQA